MPVETHSHLDLLSEEWDALADRKGASPFLRPGWIAAWWDAFGHGRLEVLAVRRAGELAAVLPIVRRLGGAASPTNWHTPLFAPLAEGQEAEEELLDALYRGPWPRVTLSWLPRDGGGWTACRGAAARAGRRVRTETISRSPYLRVGGDFAEYELRLSSKRRANLRRARRRLEATGELSVVVADGQVGLDGLLTEALVVEASSWKGASGTAINSNPDTERFYRRIARWAAQRGTLRLAFLRLDGRGLAFDLCFEDRGVHYLVKTGYDPEFGSYSPGVLLRREMIARAFESGLRRYEFLGAEADWKREWTETSHELGTIEAFKTSLRGVLDAVALTVARPMLARVRARLGR
ncbi:MAG: GNAT family N-acetyltransferase [Actinomycetota bacterium]|nr:GNAT family N-acetyltransferase [Actinomycetota bacterium]